MFWKNFKFQYVFYVLIDYNQFVLKLFDKTDYIFITFDCSKEVKIYISFEEMKNISRTTFKKL